MLPPGSLDCIAFHANGLYAGGKVMQVVSKRITHKCVVLTWVGNSMWHDFRGEIVQEAYIYNASKVNPVELEKYNLG